MAQTTTAPTLSEAMAELAALSDPKVLIANQQRGDDHGVNLAKLRALAKRYKTQHELARDLWNTTDDAARLLAILVCRPKSFKQTELGAMLRQAVSPKVQDWLVNYVVKKSPYVRSGSLRSCADGADLHDPNSSSRHQRFSY